MGNNPHLQITGDVLKTALTYESYKTEDLLSVLLQHGDDLRITDDMFRVAATCGSTHGLRKLASYAHLEDIPTRWVDIARLCNAAIWGDIGLLKSLLQKGVECDLLSPYGTTPLYWAARLGHTVAVQMLLSAGAAPILKSHDQDPPWEFLYQATKDRFPFYYAMLYDRPIMTKVLLEAGASTDIDLESGKSLSEIAKDQGSIIIYNYLEQHKRDQAKLAREKMS